jgi:type IV secretory pathway VirB10-like protein
MSQANENQNTAPNLQDKRKPAPGVLPKNAQTWVVIGLTTVIMLMLWVSGPAKGAKSPQKTDAPKTETVAGLSPAEISARLEQQRREQQTPFIPPQRPLSQQSGSRDFASPAGNQEAAVPVEEDPIKQDMRRREYTSRFSSSVSLSYRPQQTGESAGATVDPSAQLPMGFPALEIPSLPPGLGNGTVPAAQSSPPSVETPRKKSNPSFNQASGKDYVVFEGTVLETVLVTRLNGDFSGPVICMLTNNIYSHDGQRLLIPAGTKVLGETKRVEGFGQTRLAVAFHRLIMPDGYSVDLDQFHGLNQIGETGLKDQVNHHYLQIFGASIAVGAIGGLAQVGTNTNSLGLPQTPTDAYRQGVAASFAQSSTHILDRFLNLLPTITIREGHRVKVYLMQDLLVPDYAQHEMPSNL